MIINPDPILQVCSAGITDQNTNFTKYTRLRNDVSQTMHENIDIKMGQIHNIAKWCVTNMA